MKFFFFILLGFEISAQNLVPNPSFEIYSQCPINFADITPVDSWYRLPIHNGTPDYFNACNSSYLNVPNNIPGSQAAFDGNAYIGISTYSSNYINFREYIQTQLTSPMIAGQTYLVSFYVSCADENRYSSNNIGAIFTVSSLSGNNWSNTSLNITPHINYPTPITNITGWTLISGSYVASGNEQYLTVGNFYNDDLTQFVSINTSGATGDAYYYIDQVNVVQSPLGNSDFSQEKYQILPNPVADKFTILSNQSEVITNIELYSTYNRLKSFKPIDSIYNVEDLPSGIYYIILTFESNRKRICKIIKL